MSNLNFYTWTKTRALIHHNRLITWDIISRDYTNYSIQNKTNSFICLYVQNQTYRQYNNIIKMKDMTSNKKSLSQDKLKKT